ncbi:MAG TPA: hypothetical protein VF482_21370 [Trebonia sp.]
MVWKPREEHGGRRTWPAPTGLLAGYCSMAAATAVAVAVGGTHRPGVALGIVSFAVFAVAIRTTVPVALVTGAMGTLFYAGFIIGRHAQLAWHGAADFRWLCILLGAALCGTAASWIHAQAVDRRMTAAEPNRGRPAPVINLADARAARRR